MSIPGNLLSAATESMDPTWTGWRARLNSTLGGGTGGRNGDKCLSVKSNASGEAQAETVTGYPVAPGTIYQVFSDTAGATEVERVGIEWLNATYTPVGPVTWSLWTATASSSWHRVGVAGRAPAGATRARIILSANPAAAARSHYWENVYFGPPMRTSGNLFAFTTESSELDASGWTPLVNASISRQVPTIQWPVDEYQAGAHTIAMTATAAGNASILAIGGPSITPGVQYVAQAYLQPPVLTATAWIELRTFDANGNQISADRSTLAAPGTGLYRQTASAVALPNAASATVAVGLDGASAGQILRVETVILAPAPEVAPGTILRYADAEFEQGTGSWTRVSGVATLARSTPWGAAALLGGYSLAIASATATTSVLRTGLYPVTPGVNWRSELCASPGAGGWTDVTVSTRWYDVDGVDLGASPDAGWALPGPGWWILSADAVAPAGAVQAAVELSVTATAVNSAMSVDTIALRQVLPQNETTAHSAAGYISITFRELILGRLLSIYRVTPDGHRALVRGPAGLINQQPITSTVVVIEDHEAPMGVPVYYVLEQLAIGSTTPGTRVTGSLTLTMNVNECWMKDPGNPQRNLKVLVAKAPDWDRPIEQAVNRVHGRRNAVIFSGKRGGLEGDLAIWTRSDEERKSLHLLLDDGNTLLWQAMPGMGVDDMYVQVGAAPEARTGGVASDAWRAWTLSLTEQDMPVTTGVGSAVTWTWADVAAEFATWDDVRAAFATWEDLLLNRRGV